MQPIQDLRDRGQSVWLDFIRRSLIESGDLASLVAAGVSGLTSNPSIFEQAIAGSDEYDDDIARCIAGVDAIDPAAVFEDLAVADIRLAADVVRRVYDTSDGADGYVSLEVSPRLAHDTDGTVAEAKRLWAAVDRPNLMIKVPATAAGFPAIEELIASGINVNATLIFSLDQYRAVAGAYVRGLERTARPDRIASVASFFVSRVDTAADRALDTVDETTARDLKGVMAIANAKLAYEIFGEIFGARFDGLRSRGARPQRVLWASTSTKNPVYPDVMYVEELIGPDTVNTIPPATLDDFRDHGRVRGDTLTEDVEGARSAIAAFQRLGLDLESITDRLLVEGVDSFAASYEALLAAIVGKAAQVEKAGVNQASLNLGGYSIAARIARWDGEGFVRRLWERDHTLWADDPDEIANRLGWLTLPEVMTGEVEAYRSFADEVVAEQIRHVVLLGMGGSSLAPEVYQATFGNADGYPELVILDSTHPDAVRHVEDAVDLGSTLLVVASKSGTTLEPLSFFRYFWDRVSSLNPEPGRQFIAISDPGSGLVGLAEERGFRRVFEAVPDVGGRYSALTAFGLVPAALIGADIDRLLATAGAMSRSAREPAKDNPGLELGAALGELAVAGRDKATYLTSPTLEAFPAWVEQLIAESTGKNGTGIVPIADEPAGSPDVYGDDRLFISMTLAGDGAAAQTATIDAVEAAGHPVVRIEMADAADLGGEIFRAEFAVAAAGAVLGIQPFDQPDVELAKKLARSAMGEAGNTASVDEVRTDDPGELRAALRAWAAQIGPGDYVALQAYLKASETTRAELQRLRTAIRDRHRVATTLGYGPRFLHSTGQLHKGGGGNGVFLQIVDEPVDDLAIPETDFTFGAVIAAQATGDYLALRGRKRRILRINIGRDVAAGLAKLNEAFDG